MHVALRRVQVLVSGQSLDRPCWRSTHGAARDVGQNATCSELELLSIEALERRSKVLRVGCAIAEEVLHEHRRDVRRITPGYSLVHLSKGENAVSVRSRRRLTPVGYCGSPGQKSAGKSSTYRAEPLATTLTALPVKSRKSPVTNSSRRCIDSDALNGNGTKLR